MANKREQWEYFKRKLLKVAKLVCKPNQCYSSSFEMLKRYPAWKLVHGVCLGQGNIEGKQIGHAWLEYEGIVFDPNRKEFYTKSLYYTVGHIEHSVSYTIQDALNLYDVFSHPGPWDSKIQQAHHFKE